MSRDLVLNLIKLSLLGALTLLLVVRVWQGDEVEKRILDLQGVVNERAGKLDTGVAALDERTEKLARDVSKLAAEGVRAAPTPESGIAHPPSTGSTGGPGAVDKPSTEAPGGVDPRTLPYWPTPDNILTDLSQEPVPPADAPRGGVIRYYTAANPTSLNV
ncbi:MAG TPA: hypothetical protein VFY93_18720, partial [Planctomycetota bacterium]|nr:hypothetical protein [Planctomycetota bacterium]